MDLTVCARAGCGATDGLATCSGCRTVAYCSTKDCQRVDWAARHKRACREARAASTACAASTSMAAQQHEADAALAAAGVLVRALDRAALAAASGVSGAASAGDSSISVSDAYSAFLPRDWDMGPGRATKDALLHRRNSAIACTAGVLAALVRYGLALPAHVEADEKGDVEGEDAGAAVHMLSTLVSAAVSLLTPQAWLAHERELIDAGIVHLIVRQTAVREGHGAVAADGELVGCGGEEEMSFMTACHTPLWLSNQLLHASTSGAFAVELLRARAVDAIGDALAWVMRDLDDGEEAREFFMGNAEVLDAACEVLRRLGITTPKLLLGVLSTSKCRKSGRLYVLRVFLHPEDPARANMSLGEREYYPSP